MILLQSLVPKKKQQQQQQQQKTPQATGQRELEIYHYDIQL